MSHCWRRILLSTDVQPLTAALTKRLDAAHHRRQRRILGISWKDRITNVEVRTRTRQQTMDKYWEKDDFTGLDMFCVWTISAYHSKHCTGRHQGIREDQVDQERTGGAQSTKTSTQDGIHLGRSRGGSSWQTRMASKCGPMCPVGCGMNEGYGCC